MLERLTHESAAPLKGNPARALEAAVFALTSAGFKLENKTSSSVEMTAVPMTRSGQNPLVGASKVTVTNSGGRLSVTAELGGVARMARLLRVIPTTAILVIAVGITITVLVVLETMNPAIWSVLGVLVATDLFFILILAPAVARRLEARARAALDTLVMNASAMVADA